MTKEELIQKLTSRKFWLAIAAFLASAGSAVGGMATGNDTLAGAGVVCCAISAGIYAFAEAYVDGERAKANSTTTTKTVTAQATDKATVQAALGTAEKAE